MTEELTGLSVLRSQQAFVPVAILLISFAFGIQAPNRTLVCIVGVSPMFYTLSVYML